MRPVASVIFVIAVVGCKRSVEKALPDPTPPVVPDATPAPTTTRMALHGRIVDVATGKVVFPLRGKLPRDEATGARAAYVLDDDGVLRAWELDSGALRWQVATTAQTLAMGTTRLFVADAPSGLGGGDITAIDASGVARGIFGKSWGIGELHALGDDAVFRSGTGEIGVVPVGGGFHRFMAGAPLGTFVDQRSTTLTVGDAICFAERGGAATFEVKCVDRGAKETVHGSVNVGKPADPPSTHYAMISAARHHLLLGTFSFGGTSAARRGVVVRLSDGGEALRVEDELVAIVESKSGALEGAVTVAPEIRFYEPTGKVRWTHKPKVVERFGKVFAKDDRLIFATHDIIATGVQVFALRKSDGALLWTGDTRLPPIGHSKYHNTVTLEERGDAVILRGHESSVEHVHVYDAATGALRHHDP